MTIPVRSLCTRRIWADCRPCQEIAAACRPCQEYWLLSRRFERITVPYSENLKKQNKKNNILLDASLSKSNVGNISSEIYVERAWHSTPHLDPMGSGMRSRSQKSLCCAWLLSRCVQTPRGPRGCRCVEWVVRGVGVCVRLQTFSLRKCAARALPSSSFLAQSWVGLCHTITTRAWWTHLRSLHQDTSVSNSPRCISLS